MPGSTFSKNLDSYNVSRNISITPINRDWGYTLETRCQSLSKGLAPTFSGD